MEGEWIERGRLWKERARSLQLQIRGRFRVAVDRHWTRLQTSSSSSSSSSSTSHDYPPTLQRWIHRARRFLIDPSSPTTSPASLSSRFYRKRVDKDIDEIDDSIIIRLLQAVAVPVLGNACHIFMHGLNHIQVYGAEKLHQALLQRPEGKPLVTVSNHVAAVDDPFVIASLLPPSVMLDSRNIRWTLCASDRCFTNPMFSAFFQCVKVLPVSRGEGLYQKGMDMALSKLNNGAWVHVFPEGSRSRDGGRTVGAAKRGVGRLVMDADNIPVVIPFVHTGMQEIMPVGTHFPKIGKKVTVLVGDPINFEDLRMSADDPDRQVSRGVLYDAVSSRIGHQLQELKLQVDRLVLEQSLKLHDSYLSDTERASGIWQHVDWEAFGLGGSLPSWEDRAFRNPIISNEACLYSDMHQGPNTTYRSIKMGFSFEGGIVSRIRGYMNPSELMGFAAKGLFMDIKMSSERSTRFQEVKALKVWKQFVEAHVLC